MDCRLVCSSPELFAADGFHPNILQELTGGPRRSSCFHPEPSLGENLTHAADQIVSLSLLVFVVLHSVTLFPRSGLISSHFFPLPSQAVSGQPPACRGGQHRGLLFMPLSWQIHQRRLEGPKGLNRKRLHAVVREGRFHQISLLSCWLPLNVCEPKYVKETFLQDPVLVGV